MITGLFYMNKISVRKRTRTSTKNVHIPEQEVTRLHKEPLPISNSKYHDLQSLKQVIEKDHHPLYDSLKYLDIARQNKKI